MKKLSFKKKITFSGLLSCLLTAWLISSSIIIFLFGSAGRDVSLIKTISLPMFIAIIFVAFVPITIADIVSDFKNFSQHCLLISIIFFSFFLCLKVKSVSVYIMMSAVILIALYCFDKQIDISNVICKPVSDKKTLSVTICVFIIATILIALISVFRYVTYYAPNYDFGIFCQMFYNMKKSLQPITTCERDKLLSHFAVHVSPIYYLILPLYAIIPSPVTLAVIQPVIIFSGIIPTYLIAKHLKFDNKCVMFISLIYAFYAVFSTGMFYDLHENCFLVPLLLWMFFFFEKDKKVPMFIFMGLTLLVKEDAFVYIAIFALYAIISRKKFVQGSAMLVISGVYFITVSYLLTKYGNGVMSSRYENLECGGGLLEAVKTIIINPGFAINETLSVNNDSPDKFFYIAQLLLPLGLIPLCSKNFSRYILILPMFINLLTRYQYQYNINYQYSFGIAAFMIYLMLLNLSDIEPKKRGMRLFGAVVLSFILFMMVVMPKLTQNIINFEDEADSRIAINTALEIIPDDASVTCSTYFLPHLAKRDVIYEDEYHDDVSTEYFILDMRQPVAKGRDKKYIDAGYKLIYEVPEVIRIYQFQQ